MADELNDTTADARYMAVEVVTAYLSNPNTRVSNEEVQALIRDTFATFSNLSAGGHSAPVEEAPASTTKSKAEIRKSIGADALISFEDGKSYQSLKRHLTTRGMTMGDYKAKHGLPSDYPSVHPSYSARRSEMAKAIGLGQKGRQSKAAPSAAPKAKKPRAAKAPPAK